MTKGLMTMAMSALYCTMSACILPMSVLYYTIVYQVYHTMSVLTLDLRLDVGVHGLVLGWPDQGPHTGLGDAWGAGGGAL